MRSGVGVVSILAGGSACKQPAGRANGVGKQAVAKHLAWSAQGWNVARHLQGLIAQCPQHLRRCLQQTNPTHK